MTSGLASIQSRQYSGTAQQVYCLELFKEQEIIQPKQLYRKMDGQLQ